MNNTTTLEMLQSLIQQAKEQLASVGQTVGIVLAPTLIVADAMQTERMLAGKPAWSGDCVACFLCEGVIVLGMLYPTDHPHRNVASVWSDEQFNPPEHDQGDPDDHPHLCPLNTPVPDIATHPLENAMWGIQMDDWMLHIAPTVLAMTKTEPVICAQILTQPL